MSRRLVVALAVAAVAVLAAAPAGAQSVTMDWHTVDAGGAASSGGAYELEGTMGQPDAGTLSGGAYTLKGGFWAGVGGARCDADGDGDCDAVDLAWVIRCAADPANCGCPGNPDLDRSGTIDGDDTEVELSGIY